MTKLCICGIGDTTFWANVAGVCYSCKSFSALIAKYRVVWICMMFTTIFEGTEKVPSLVMLV